MAELVLTKESLSSPNISSDSRHLTLFVSRDSCMFSLPSVLAMILAHDARVWLSRLSHTQPPPGAPSKLQGWGIVYFSAQSNLVNWLLFARQRRILPSTLEEHISSSHAYCSYTLVVCQLRTSPKIRATPTVVR
jgi:hypothetical protein